MEDLFDQISSPPPLGETTPVAEQEIPIEESQVFAEAPAEEGGEEGIEEASEDETSDEPNADDTEEAPKTEAPDPDAKAAKDASVQTQKKAEPAKTVNVVEEDPYEFDKCLISIGIGLLPTDGHPDGRPVMLGIRNHQDEPIVRMCRLSDLGPLPDPLQQLLDQLKEELPARSAKAAEKMKKAEAAKSKAKVTAGKTVPPAKAQKVEKPKPASMNLFDMFDLNP